MKRAVSYTKSTNPGFLLDASSACTTVPLSYKVEGTTGRAKGCCAHFIS